MSSGWSRCFLALVLASGLIHAQSTAALQGTVVDSSGAALQGARVTARNTGTGEDRTTQTDDQGAYLLPSLPIGNYRVEVNAPGLQTTSASGLVLEVGRTVRQDFTMKVASATETVEIQATAPLVESTSVSVGAVVNQKTVQEIPLNGRHFVDLGLLIPGSVTPPQNGFLTAPLRGQGSFAFNTAGNREDTVNYMINGINLSDPAQNQITFQPTINTVSEFKVDNSTYSAEYGRNSGAIVNIATRSGTNEWHGEAYEFLRNNALDARNFSNPKGVTQSPFKRNQFGGDAGGFLKRDKTFVFLSYEGLRQRQGVPLSTRVLSAAERLQAQTAGDAVIKKLVTLIPEANSPGGVYVSSATAPVDIDQGTVNFSHSFTPDHRVNFYYAFQRDLRSEPPTTQASNLPGYGDHRQGRRQIFTFNDTKVFTSAIVNEARLGYNRIHITFDPESTLNPADYGINSGVVGNIGIPQITVTGAFAFGGVNNFPQGRGDYTAVASDTLSWVRGKHSIKFGGEFRRLNNDNYTLTPGTFGFANIQAFLNDQANAFTANPSNRASRVYGGALGFFVQDAYKITRNLLLDVGLRYDWNMTPTEAANRFVKFDPVSDSLIRVGTSGGPGNAYNQSNRNFEPRLGFAWDVFGSGRTVVRSAYAIQTDQPIFGLVTPLAANPPFAFPVSFSPTAATPFVSFVNAFQAAGGTVSPTSVAQNYKNAYVQSWNFNVQQALGNSFSMTAGYYANKGTNLNVARNYNQPVNGVRPYPVLSASSPIFAGRSLSNVIVYESVGNSSYNGLWLTFNKRFSKGLQFSSSYTFSKSIDYNSRNVQGLTVQDSYNVRGDRGLSDFDVRHRFVINGIYELPFHGNRLVEGWQLSTIFQTQSGNPVTFFSTNRTFNGAGTLRASVTGPVQTGYSPAVNGNASFVQYIQNPSVFVNQGNAFGNLGRNTIIGPGFTNLDVAVVKNTRIFERLTWQIRADAFDVLNQANFGQPGTSFGTATFGVITNTRFAPGDSGSSRQLQLAMKLIF